MAILRLPVGRALVARTVRVAIAFGCLVTAVAAPGLREHQIKAAALCNIIAFTEWPAPAFATPESPLVFGVLGVGPIESLLDEFLANETWQGRPVKLRRLRSPAEARVCHVLFVARSEHARWPALAKVCARLPILTVSDAENFARQGGIVQLAVERNKLQLIVNLGAVRSSGLVISSKVLRLANVIGDSTP
jgi:hypothetical protein